MRRPAFTILGVLALVLAWTGTGLAQAEHYANRPLELNLHAGALSIDGGDDGDRETELLLGARLVYNMASGFGIGGNFDWARESENDFDIDLFLYSVDLNYTFPSQNRAHFFVAGGVGAATVSPDEDLEEFGVESDTHLLVPFGGGVKWFNRTFDPSWGIRAEVRDNVVFVGDDEIVIDGVPIEIEGETTHNIEISGGVSFFFGGGR